MRRRHRGSRGVALGRAIGMALMVSTATVGLIPMVSPGHEAQAQQATPQRGPWGYGFSPVVNDVRAGRPLVVHVIIPLCSRNILVSCGTKEAGEPDNLDGNLYWGALFGARRIFERKRSAWTRISQGGGSHPVLERLVYRRTISGRRWGAGAEVEQLVVLDAYHGDSINTAVEHFWKLASDGGSVTFSHGGRQRSEKVHVAGYAGFNRALAGLASGKVPGPKGRGSAPIPSFVLAGESSKTFGPGLRKAGSRTLLMTQDTMAPEGYLIDAVVRALGDNEPPRQIRARATRTYAKWQRLEEEDVRDIFTSW